MLFSSTDSLREQLRNAEKEMLDFATGFGSRRHGDFDIQIRDTVISRSSIPFKPNKQEDDELTIHGIRVTSHLTDEHCTKTPLVLQHGYMNASCFFYRNLVGLSSQFETIHSLDMLGWGLSSRPSFDLMDDSVETAQDFFVESLDEWRKKNGIEKMILAGHSMGGYLSVAYCEKYPQHVEQLLLLSPVGIPEETEEIKARRKSRFSLSRRLAFSLYSMVFDNPCSMIQTLPRYKGQQYMESYVKNRLPAISDPQERTAFAEYLYFNCALPVSGAKCLNRILNAFAYAKKPLLYRISLIKVPRISFLYGSDDWMDVNAALEAHRLCQEQMVNGLASPIIKVYKVPNAGHLLMLDNWEGFDEAIVAACNSTSTAVSDSSDLQGPTELTSRVDDDGSLKPPASQSTAQPAPQVVYN